MSKFAFCKFFGQGGSGCYHESVYTWDDWYDDDSPPAQVIERGMYVWVPTGTSNPISTVTKQQNLAAFCLAQGVTVVYLDMYNYLGSTNYTAGHVTTMRSVISQLKASGVKKVFALAGDIDWTSVATQTWIQANITNNIITFNSGGQANEKFDGFILDVEYWIDNTQTTQGGCSGLITLIQEMQSSLALPIGVYLDWYLLDGTGTRQVTINGKTGQDGAAILDVADWVVAGTYRDTANIGAGGDSLIGLMQPWYDYAVANTRTVYASVETTNISPGYATFYHQTKASMETEITIANAAFTSVQYEGMVVHDYAGWSVMT